MLNGPTPFLFFFFFAHCISFLFGYYTRLISYNTETIFSPLGKPSRTTCLSFWLCSDPNQYSRSDTPTSYYCASRAEGYIPDTIFIWMRGGQQKNPHTTKTQRQSDQLLILHTPCTFCHKLLVLPLVECIIRYIYGMFCNKYVVKIVCVTYYVIKMLYGSDINNTVCHAYFVINY